MSTKNIEQFKFIQQELSDAKKQLFFANSVRQAKFLQSKIIYLTKLTKQFESRQ